MKFTKTKLPMKVHSACTLSHNISYSNCYQLHLAMMGSTVNTVTCTATVVISRMGCKPWLSQGLNCSGMNLAKHVVSLAPPTDPTVVPYPRDKVTFVHPSTLNPTI